MRIKPRGISNYNILCVSLYSLEPNLLGYRRLRSRWLRNVTHGASRNSSRCTALGGRIRNDNTIHTNTFNFNSKCPLLFMNTIYDFMPGAFALRPTATGRRKRAPGPSPTKAGMVIPRVNASDFSLFLYPYTPKYHSSKFSLPDQTDSAVDCTGPRSGGLWSPR